MSALFLELARTVLFLSSSPHMFSLRIIFSMAQHGEVAKTLPPVRLTTHKLIVSIDAAIGVELLAGKHVANVLPHFVLARHLQILCQLCHRHYRGEPASCAP